MNYVTMEVEIDHGRVVPKGLEHLPDKAFGLLTIMQPAPVAQLRPIGLAKGEFVVPDKFNAPLPEEVLGSFEGK